ncbi:MAG TPA: DUF1003 domain-containing protein [Cytophaga sp.]|jgi:uncharacterized membrane protein|nr:DUF1003 domain-containing protein [Cytophaga sp.]
MNKDINDLLKSEAEKLTKFQQIVQEAIDEEKLIVENLLHQPEEVLTLGQRISDRVASFGGSWKFIISFSIILTVWILFNTLAPNREDFDPYPFILMNLVLSTVAAFQAPIIMMSQNRKEEKDRKRTENNHLINLKAELEVRSLHQKIDLLLEEQIQILFEIQAEQVILLKSIETKIDAK